MSAIGVPFLFVDIPNEDTGIELQTVYERNLQRYSSVYGWDQMELSTSSTFFSVCKNNISSVLEKYPFRNYQRWINVSSMNVGTMVTVGENTTITVIDQVRVGSYDCWEGYQDNETLVYYVKEWGLFFGRRWNTTVGSFWYTEEINLISTNYAELETTKFRVEGLMISLLIVELSVGVVIAGLIQRDL
ncbi:MAG: hypothetical protein ACW96M_01485 [Candidatus Thorarchaeota archaeon]